LIPQKIPKEKTLNDRDLSWLSFNYRLLMEARDAADLPIYEKIKFLAIFSSNLDEFFRVRVSELRSLKTFQKKENDPLKFNPSKILKAIHKEVVKQQEEFGEIFQNLILPELAKNNIQLLSGFPAHPEHQEFIRSYFYAEVLPYIQPIVLFKSKIIPFLQNQALYLALKITLKETNGKQGKKKPSRYAIVQIPSHIISRFVSLPAIDGQEYIMMLDDVLLYNLPEVMPGYDITETYSVKLSRGADLNIADEYSGDLVQKIKASLNKRKIGLPARFLYDKSMPKDFLKFLKTTFNLSKDDLVPGGKYHNLMDLMSLPNPFFPNLENEKWAPLEKIELEGGSLFNLIDKKDRILHYPYHKYEPVLIFFNEAANDPEVTEIKSTQYRVANNSAIVQALIAASKNGKKVTVFVELKARFDEEANLKSALEMEKAGVKIIYSIPNLKVHTKVALVAKLQSGTIHNYAYLSTGNFNEKTATIYSDHGLFTSDKNICAELKNMFSFLENGEKEFQFSELLVSQFNIRERFKEMIDNEIKISSKGGKSAITIKLNGLEDEEMIDKLYEASSAGVSIQLIVRGICRLRAGVKNLSENISITRLVDRYLEHARVFIFSNGGNELIYLGSADWMTRNLSHRVEVIFPVKDLAIRKEIRQIIDFQLQDNVKAVWVDANLLNIYKKNTGQILQSQLEIYKWLKNKEGRQALL